jgi:hypothetical protein
MNDFWDKNAGITATPQESARASARNAAARSLMDASSLTAAEVAELLRLPLPTIQRVAARRILYSYLANGLAVFPAWQFNAEGTAVVPSLGDVLFALPSDLHPQSVAGFFLTPQPDLVLDGRPASVKAWLEAGGSMDLVLALAEGLAAGY